MDNLRARTEYNHTFGYYSVAIYRGERVIDRFGRFQSVGEADLAGLDYVTDPANT